MKQHQRRRRLTALGSVVAMVAASLALTIGLAGPAGATSNGTTGYEADCPGVGLAASNTAPFGVFDINGGKFAYPIRYTLGFGGKLHVAPSRKSGTTPHSAASHPPSWRAWPMGTS